VIHQEVDGVAFGTTAEAVIELLLTAYGERGGFLVMERTARVLVLTLLFQLNAGIDKIHDIRAGK
jgi:hypothetical protein